MHRGIFDRSEFKVTRDISPTMSGWLLVLVSPCFDTWLGYRKGMMVWTGDGAGNTNKESCSILDVLVATGRGM